MPRFAAVGALFLALAIVKSLPLLRHFRTHIAGDLFDPLFHVWVLAWDVHALTTAPLRLFDANMFYPVERALAFGEHMVGALPVFAPVYLLTGSPVAGYNAVFVLSFAASALAAFALAHFWTRALLPSMVAGTLFGFAPYRFAQITHIVVLDFFWAPLALLFLERFLRARRWRDLAAFAIFYWLQALSSVYLAFIVTLAVVLWVGYHAWAVDRSLLSRSLAPKALAFAGASLTVLGPLHWPYLEFQRRWGTVRSLNDAEGVDVLSYLSAPPLMNDLYASRLGFMGFWENQLFPGLVVVALIVAGSLVTVRDLPERDVRRLRRAAWLLIAAGVVLTLGPKLTLFRHATSVPLPYALLYYVVPGWASMRNPGRFIQLALLGAVPLTALGALGCLRIVAEWRHSARWARVAPPMATVIVLAAFFWELGAKPMPLAAVPTIADSHRWLATARPGPVLAIPFGQLPTPFEDIAHLYRSTAHWLPLVNGYSSYLPPFYAELTAALAELPAADAVEAAGALGVRTVLVHGEQAAPRERARWARSGLRATVIGGDVAYAVPPVVARPSLRAELSVPEWLPARGEAKVGLLLEAAEPGPWAHPGPQGLSRAVVQWTEVATGRVVETRSVVQLPALLRRGETAAVTVRLDRLPGPGRYTARLSLPERGAATGPRPIEIRSGSPPTTAEGGRPLVARYVVASGTPIVVEPEWQIANVTATNAGDVVWLARAKGKRGVVRLEWRWLRDDRVVAEGWMPLRYDVHPGQSHPFRIATAPPAAADSYVLAVGVVSTGTARAVATATPPLRMAVEVVAGRP